MMKTPNNKLNKKSLLKGALLTGAVIGFASATPVQSTNLYDFNDLGSAFELRTELMSKNLNPLSSEMFRLELKCGEEGTQTKSPSTTKTAKTKTTENKCGEGKCGEETKTAKKENTKTANTKTTKTTKTKTTENKCGEGKCGNE